MADASLTLDPAYRLGSVDPRLYGSFVEHLGRCVYEGIYEPGHPDADADGFRTDVLDLVGELGVTMVRYPGGNFVSNYRWQDGVGSVPDRPRRLDLAWRSTESNAVGTNEFMSWCRAASVEPLWTVNLGSRGMQAARDLVEYCNHPAGSRWSDLRIAHGVRQPHNIRLWCLGNELDGDWQIGHKTAAEYGRLAAETAKAMRLIDPDLELVACGSSGTGMDTFAAWDAEVLEHTYDHVDHLSLHAYHAPRDGDIDSFLAAGVAMDTQIEAITATCDHVRARRGSTKQITLSFDEWNVWYSDDAADAGRPGRSYPQAPHLLENVYSAMDAVVVGSLLNSLLRHADRVRIACLAQLVNVIAPIATQAGGPAWRQSIFHPFALTARHGRGDALRVATHAPHIDTKAHGPVSALDVAATQAPDGTIAMFLVNRQRDQPLRLDADLRAAGPVRLVDHRVLHDDDPGATNTVQRPDRVAARPGVGAELSAGRLQVTLPPMSWTMLRTVPTAG